MAALAVAGDLGAHHLSSVAVARAAGVVVAHKLGAVGELPAAESAACGREAELEIRDCLLHPFKNVTRAVETFVGDFVDLRFFFLGLPDNKMLLGRVKKYLL